MQPMTSGYKIMNQFQWHEVVRVDSPVFLVSSTHCACRYETCDGAPLPPGYYLSLWPARACRSYYGPQVRHFGPCATQAQAQLLQTSAVALGLVKLEPALAAPALAIRYAASFQHSSRRHGALMHAAD